MFIESLDVKICMEAKNSRTKSLHFEDQNDDLRVSILNLMFFWSNPYKIKNDIKGALKKVLP